ncbi:MAG: AEC family transporter [Rickettsiaceae bacterium]|nr:AEC family transporter [Rickettsiaceae bacterium]
MFDIFDAVLPIFLIIALGTFFKKNWLKSEEFWRGLERLSYFVLFPAALFNSISSANFIFIEQAKLILALVATKVIVTIGLMILWKKKNFDKVIFTSVFQGSIRFNNYIFFALGTGLYGYEGMKIVSIISAYMIIFTNIVSVLMFNYYLPDNVSEETKIGNFIKLFYSLISNPLVIASVAGFIFNYCEIVLPKLCSNFLLNLANCALTIGGITVGANLKFIQLSGSKLLGISVVTKLFIVPCITAILLAIFKVEGLDRLVAIVYSVLPCSSTSYILSKQLGGDPDSMTQIITMSTALSIITIPTMLYILG